MDKTTEAIASWASAMWAREYSEDSYQLATVRLLDSLGCVAAGYPSPPAKIVRQVVGLATKAGEWSGAVLGSGERARLDGAGFANTVALDYWDANDVYAVAGSGHPSDVIPALTIASASAHRTGKELLKAVLVAYELFGALNDAYVMRVGGWDQGTYVAAACGVATALLAGLDAERLQHALCLAIVPNIALRQTRAGDLSMWKSCSTGIAIQNSLLAVELARQGMTAPQATFEGRHGLFEQITDAFQISDFLSSDGEPQRIVKTNLKAYPAEHHAQAAIDATREIRAAHDLRSNEIESIVIGTHAFALSEIADDESKWLPTNKETADHSLPFLVAAALAFGTVSRETFSPQMLANEDIRQLLKVTTLEEVPELTAGLPDRSGAHVSVITHGGRSHVAKRAVAPGHWSAPLSRSDLEEKIHRFCAGLATENALNNFIETCWRSIELGDATEVVAAFPRISSDREPAS